MFPQPLSQRERFEALKANLMEAYKYIDSQEDQASIQWIDNMEAQFKSGFKCIKDNLRHKNCCTCPKMNETDRQGQPLPKNVIRCTLFEK